MTPARAGPAGSASASPPGLLPVGLLSVGLLLGGCRSVSDIAGLAVGGGAGVATGNPVLGFAVGVGARAAVDELRGYVVRSRHGGEQDAIADAAGAAPVGVAVPWEVRHTIPIGNTRGELAVAREFATPLTTCREVVFSVQDGAERSLFVTALCRRGDRWKWAAAEPAVGRWGVIQGGP